MSDISSLEALFVGFTSGFSIGVSVVSYMCRRRDRLDEAHRWLRENAPPLAPGSSLRADIHVVRRAPSGPLTSEDASHLDDTTGYGDSIGWERLQ